MPTEPTPSPRYRFGAFDFAARTGELLRDGRRVRLPGQAAALLETLLERAGQMVTREELRARLWPDGTNVDFDHGLANAAQRLRDALGDSAASPHYVETLPRRGYRFIAAVTWDAPGHYAASATRGKASHLLLRRARGWTAAALALAGLATLAVILLRAPAVPVAAGDATPAKPRLVVLPFENLTGDSSEDYFVDGVTDELITRLGRLAPERLEVVGRTSAMRYRGAAVTARIARELNAGYALEGSVRREGQRVRVTARLVRLADGAQQWTAVFHRDVHSVLDVQDDIAGRVAAALSVRVLPGAREQLALGDTRHPAAREAYLRGMWFVNKKTPEGASRAVEYLQQAVALDANYARAHAALAWAHHFCGAMGVTSHDTARRLTRESADRALELDSTSGDALAALAESRFRFGGETEGIEEMFRRAAALRPQDPDLLHWYGMFLALTGRTEQALTQLERARELDPVALHLGVDYAEALYHAGRRAEAMQQLDRVRELDPLFPKTYLVQAAIALQEGRHAEAIAALHRANELSPATPKYVAWLARVYAAAGRQTEARRALGELRALSGRVHVAPELIRTVERDLRTY